MHLVIIKTDSIRGTGVQISIGIYFHVSTGGTENVLFTCLHERTLPTNDQDSILIPSEIAPELNHKLFDLIWINVKTMNEIVVIAVVLYGWFSYAI